MTDVQQQRTTPLAGGDLEPCRECGAQLAADQRYCLNCGRRRGEPRLDFRQHLPTSDPSTNGAAPAAAAAAPPPSDPPPEQRQRDYTPLAAAGGIAVLGLMLLVGVLIGRGDGEQAVAPPPQVLRVGGGEEEAGGGEGSGTAKEGGSAKPGKQGKGAKNAANSGGSPPPASITADEGELEALQGKTGKEYSEAAADLPDEIATPGAAPPEDNKAPGGGSEGTAIE
jgi:hypothetical protein